jgi:hypothetical protein
MRPISKGETDRTKGRIAQHAKLMRELQEQGMSREEASAEAFKRMGKR